MQQSVKLVEPGGIEPTPLLYHTTAYKNLAFILSWRLIFLDGKPIPRQRVPLPYCPSKPLPLLTRVGRLPRLINRKIDDSVLTRKGSRAFGLINFSRYYTLRGQNDLRYQTSRSKSHL